MVHDDDTGSRHFRDVPDDDRPGPWVRPRPEVVQAVRKILRKHPNYVERPNIVLGEVTDELPRNFPAVSYEEVRAALRVLAGPAEPGRF